LRVTTEAKSAVLLFEREKPFFVQFTTESGPLFESRLQNLLFGSLNPVSVASEFCSSNDFCVHANFLTQGMKSYRASKS
jgi:hypothetical protein